MALVGGAEDEIWHLPPGWNSVLSLSLSMQMVIVSIQLLFFALQWISARWGWLQDVPASGNPICMWELRILSLVSMLRSIWPHKKWYAASATVAYPRLKLFGLGILFALLSLLPVM